MKFHENPPSGGNVPSRFSQFVKSSDSAYLYLKEHLTRSDNIHGTTCQQFARRANSCGNISNRTGRLQKQTKPFLAVVLALQTEQPALSRN